MVRHARQALWISRSFVRDVRKLKFKAIFRVLWDSNYRRDLQHMRRVIGDGYYTLVEMELPLYCIHPSHSINYPDWVNTLVGRMYDTLWQPPKIKVIEDVSRSREGLPHFMVVDGNHRLCALKIILSPGAKIRVLVMVKEA